MPITTEVLTFAAGDVGAEVVSKLCAGLVDQGVLVRRRNKTEYAFSLSDAVNIEAANPQKTAKFIEEVGARFVVNDPDSALLTKFAGAGTPFIVVIDGTRATKEQPDFRILYQSEGFEGTKKLRAIIDALKPPPKPAELNVHGGHRLSA